MSIQTKTRHSGFHPELFTVAAGSYASNASYGSGVTATNSYNDLTLVDKSRSIIRQEDTDVDFDVTIVLDASLAAPGFTAGDEIRVRCNVPSQSAGMYVKSLPPSDRVYTQPLFVDVELVDTATGSAPTGYVAVGLLRARYLHGGELALVLLNPAGGPPPTTAALTAGDLAVIFGQPDGTEVALRIRGSYRISNHH